MSDIAQDWCRRQTDLTDGEFRVLHHLANYHNKEKGMAWPKAGTLAKDTGKALGTVRGILRSLEEKGHIVRHPTHDNSGRQAHNNYILNITDEGEVSNIQQAGAENPVGAENPAGGCWISSRGGIEYPVPLEEPVVEPTVIEPVVTPLPPKGDDLDEPAKPKRKSKAEKARPIYDDPMFQQFWAEFPIKGQSKQNAALAFQATVNGNELVFDEVMDGLKGWKMSKRWIEGYVKDVAAWLNGAAFRDEPPPPPQGLHQLSPELQAAANTHEDWRKDPLDTNGVFNHDDVPF